MKNDYVIDGKITKIFINYKGQKKETVIDTEDLSKLLDLNVNWYGNKRKGYIYVVACTKHLNKYKNAIKLHQLLLNFPYKKEKLLVDHINGDTLDNRKENLRKVTYSQNARNIQNPKNNTSGYRGVCFHKEDNKWKVRISVDGNRISIGSFDDKKEAIKARKQAEEKYWSENDLKRIREVE